jgi:DNA integrity scanning protein DisA with diadenylate cyclase activity
VIHVSGVAGSGLLDQVVVIDVGREFPGIYAKKKNGQPMRNIESQVLEKVLSIALGIAREGREGKPVGTIFVVGDYEKVVSLQSGLGARHAAAALTALTSVIAVVVYQSTGTVSLFRSGEAVMVIEKPEP